MREVERQAGVGEVVDVVGKTTRRKKKRKMTEQE
jgi:hypothetical protein